jgi:hypothetical protein
MDSSTREFAPPVSQEWLKEQRRLSALRTGSRTSPSFDRYLNPASFVEMTEAEGRQFIDLLLSNVQKVRSNLAEARTGYTMDTSEWESLYGSLDEDEHLQEYAPRLFGEHAVVEQLVDLALSKSFQPIDVFNIMLVLCDDHVLKVHLQDFGALRRRLPDLCGWVDDPQVSGTHVHAQTLSSDNPHSYS